MDTIKQEAAALQPGKRRTEAIPAGKPMAKFFPSGAIFFFILLVALCLLIWFGIYFLMLDRI